MRAESRLRAAHAALAVAFPVIGFLARGIGLSGALGLVVAASAAIALFGPRLERGG